MKGSGTTLSPSSGEDIWGISSGGFVDIPVVAGEGYIVWANPTGSSPSMSVTGVFTVLRYFAGGVVIDIITSGTAHIYHTDGCAFWEFLIHRRSIGESGDVT